MRLMEAWASAERLFRSRGQDTSKLLGVTFERYVDRLGCPELLDGLLQSGFLIGDALLFRFSVNSRGNGNTTVWAPIFDDGRLVGLC
ncbi:hypothetical protein [Tropicimonas sediminicola]|uniref:hypothetical protein n=1 Tax=Tropicimonas sediminicola TaxID=1031541 RepID=UPI001FEB4651|nr:hypothetical protein [Tropicimonas sediminicola]